MLSTGRRQLNQRCFNAVSSFFLTFCTLGLVVSTGCSLVPDVRRKPQLLNPFPQIRTVAILPFVNQSEDPTLSGERVALAYANEMQLIRGFEVLPVGAVKLKMAEYNLSLSSGEDFQAFARYLGVDVVLIGSITDYSAYYPPRLTMKVNWYAANPGFHPVQPGYGLPWGTQDEKNIPRWVHQEAQRALAVEQLKTQTPVMPGVGPIMPEDRDTEFALNKPNQLAMLDGDAELANLQEQLPADWPDPSGFIPDGPRAQRAEFQPQHDAIISYMRSFNGHDEDLTKQLEDYFYFRDDARFGGWQAYLQRSEDFIRFCCYQHLSETLISRGGQDKSRLIFRWPIDRYQR